MKRTSNLASAAVLSLLMVYYVHHDTMAAVRRDIDASALRDATPLLKESIFDNSILNYSQYFLPRWDRVTPLDFTFLTATRRPCAQGEAPYFMSMTPNKYLRNAVRATWGSVPKIIAMTKSVDMTDTILGPFYSRDEVFRTGKYAVSETGYPASQYPPHCKGNFYLIPSKLAFRLIGVAERIPYVNMEAVHVTGILAAVIGGVKYRTFSKSQYAIHLHPGVCEYVTGSNILAEKVFPPLTFQLWERFTNRDLC